MKKELKKGNNERIAKLKTVAQDALDNGGKPKPASRNVSNYKSKLEDVIEHKDFKEAIKNSGLPTVENHVSYENQIKDLKQNIEDYKLKIQEYKDSFMKLEQGITDEKINLNNTILELKSVISGKNTTIGSLRDSNRTHVKNGSDLLIEFNLLKTKVNSTLKDYHAMASIATERLEQLEKLQSKWYVKLFGR